MRFWIVPFLIALALSAEVRASSNVEPELCYMKIHTAIEAGAQSGTFELSDANCEKYKQFYDLEYDDPSRPRLIGEDDYPQALEWPQINPDARDACWDAVIGSKYDKHILKTNRDCINFMKAVRLGTASPDRAESFYC